VFKEFSERKVAVSGQLQNISALSECIHSISVPVMRLTKKRLLAICGFLYSNVLGWGLC